MEQNMIEKFQVEELEQRYEMGWKAKKVEAEVKTDSGTLKFDSSKL
jgi:hypothetical protein